MFVTYRIVLHSYFNFEFCRHDKFIGFNWIKVMSLLVFATHLVLVLLLLCHLLFILSHFHLLVGVHVLHLVWVHLLHGWVYLMHLVRVHLHHICIHLLLFHHLLHSWISSIHFHVHCWLLFLSRCFLLLLSWRFFGWRLFSWSFFWGFAFGRWLITHIYIFYSISNLFN